MRYNRPAPCQRAGKARAHRMAAKKQWLGFVCLAVNTAASPAPRRSQDGTACSDPVASNYDSLSPTTGAAQFNNSGCLYSCGSLCSYFSVDRARTLCLIDSGADSNWTDTNSTLYVSLGTSLIVQGRVESGGSQVGRTQWNRRIESTLTGGGTVILVRPCVSRSRSGSNWLSLKLRLCVCAPCTAWMP